MPVAELLDQHADGAAGVEDALGPQLADEVVGHLAEELVPVRRPLVGDAAVVAVVVLAVQVAAPTGSTLSPSTAPPPARPPPLRRAAALVERGASSSAVTMGSGTAEKSTVGRRGPENPERSAPRARRHRRRRHRSLRPTPLVRLIVLNLNGGDDLVAASTPSPPTAGQPTGSTSRGRRRQRVDRRQRRGAADHPVDRAQPPQRRVPRQQPRPARPRGHPLRRPCQPRSPSSPAGSPSSPASTPTTGLGAVRPCSSRTASSTSRSLVDLLPGP